MSGEEIPTMTDEELGLEPVEVEVHDDAPPAAPARREIAPEEGIEELKAKLLAAERDRAQMEQAAQQAARAAHFAFHEKEDSDVALVQSALQQVQKDEKEMKAAYSAALRAGDTDKCADIVLDMQMLGQNKQQLEQGLQALQEKIVESRRRPPQQQQPQRREPDPVEDLAARVTPASAAWIRRNPECATDEVKRNKMVAAHYEAQAEGIVADSPEYFRFVEEKLGIDNSTPAPRQTQRSSVPRVPQPPAAPARGNSGSNGKRVVTLSAMERDIARMSGLSDEEYAANKMQLAKEGKLGTSH